MDHKSEKLNIFNLEIGCLVDDKVASFYIKKGKVVDSGSLNTIFDYLYDYLRELDFKGVVSIHSEDITVDTDNLKISSNLLNYKGKVNITLSLIMEKGKMRIENIQNRFLILSFHGSKLKNIKLKNLDIRSINFFCTRILGNLIAENTKRLTVLNEWCKHDGI